MIVEVLRYHGATVPDRAGRFSIEEWRDVPGYEGRYEVSSLGLVRSWVNNRGDRREFPLTLRIAKNSNRYNVVSLSGESGTRRQFRVSRLVLLAFRGDPDDGHTASHLNGDRQDDRIDNLVWEPLGDNLRRKRGHGTGGNQWGAWGKPCPLGHDNRGPSGQCRVCDRDKKRELRSALRASV